MYILYLHIIIVIHILYTPYVRMCIINPCTYVMLLYTLLYMYTTCRYMYYQSMYVHTAVIPPHVVYADDE